MRIASFVDLVVWLSGHQKKLEICGFNNFRCLRKNEHRAYLRVQIGILKSMEGRKMRRGPKICGLEMCLLEGRIDFDYSRLKDRTLADED